MRIEEANWIEACIGKHVPAPALGSGVVALNLGSGTRKSREVSKPYVHQKTILPLAGKGYRVLHSDLFEGDGIDLSGDLYDPGFQQRLRELKPGIVLFCNVLEHLPVPLRLVTPKVLNDILVPGGYLFITVPHSYPYHADPIDTMFRPDPHAVARLFAGMEVVDARIIESDSYLSEYLQGSPWKRVTKLLRLLAPFVRPRRWLSHVHRFFWLHRRYQHSCILLRKPA